MRAVEEGGLRPFVLGVKKELTDRVRSEGPQSTRVGTPHRGPLTNSRLIGRILPVLAGFMEQDMPVSILSG